MEFLSGHTAPISSLSFSSQGVSIIIIHMFIDLPSKCFMGLNCQSLGHFWKERNYR